MTVPDGTGEAAGSETGASPGGLVTAARPGVGGIAGVPASVGTSCTATSPVQLQPPLAVARTIEVQPGTVQVP